MAAGEFTYFGVLIFFVLILYTMILAIFLCIRRHNIKKALEYRNVVRGTNDATQDFYDEANFSFEFRTDFDAVTQSSLGKGCKFFLGVSRLTALAFFFTASVMLNLVKDNHGLFYFTNWNSLLVTVYYAAASAASFLGIYAKAQPSEYGFSIGAGIRWSYWVRCLGVLVHSLFEITGASSMFVMVFDFFYQRENNTDMISLLNFVRALTVVALTFELFLNNINVRFDQYPANIAWTMAYLMFVWPAVFTGVMHGWPYALLQTQTDMCFPYYFLLVLFNFAFYVVWWLIYKLKKNIYIKYNIGRVGSNYWEGESEVPHEFMLLERTMNPLSTHSGHGLRSRDNGASFYDHGGYTASDDVFAVEGFPADDYEGHYDEEVIYDPQAYNVDGVAYEGADTMNAMHDPRQYQGYDQYGQPYVDPQYDPYNQQQAEQYQYQQQYGYDPHVEHPYNDQFHGQYGGYGPETESTYSSPYSYEQHPSPFLYPNTGYPEGQEGQEFNNEHPWEAPYPSPQFAGAWDYDGVSPGSRQPFATSGGGCGVAHYEHAQYEPHATNEPEYIPQEPFDEERSLPLTYSQFGQFGEADFYPTEQEHAHEDSAAHHWVAPPKPFEGSLLERGRSGRGAGRIGGRGGRLGGRGTNGTGASSAIEGAGRGQYISSINLPRTASLPKKPIHVTAQALDVAVEGQDEEQGFGGDTGFDYSVVDSWGSFKASGNIPHNAAEAGVKPTAPSGFLSYFGFGSKPADKAAGVAAAQQAHSQAHVQKKAGEKSGGWFDSVAEDDGSDNEDYDEEHTFGPEEGDHHAGSMDASSHASGAFIASIAKREAFHAPSSLANARRKSGDATRLQKGADLGGGNSTGNSMFRPPSVPKMFRTRSREGNNEGRRPLNLQKLGSQSDVTAGTGAGTLTPKGSFTSAPLFRPPSMPRMFRASSRENLAGPGSRSLNLQNLGSGEKAVSFINNNAAGPLRTSSAARLMARMHSMEKGEYSAADEAAMFDYSEMDAWASFRASGAMPHNPDEAGTNLYKIGAEGVTPIVHPHAVEKAEKRKAPDTGGWFDNAHGDSSEENSDAYESHHLEDADLEAASSTLATHKTGAWIANSAKKEAFHTPASLAVARRKSGDHVALATKTQQAQENTIGLFRPPSVTRMFRSGSKDNLTDTNSGGRRPLNLQTLASRNSDAGSDTEKASSSMFRAPSVPKLFRTSSRESNSDGHRPLIVQTLGSPGDPNAGVNAGAGSTGGTLTPKGSFTSSPLFRPPSMPRMFRPSSRERNVPEGRSEITARKMVSLKPLGTASQGAAAPNNSPYGAPARPAPSGRLATLGSLNRPGAAVAGPTSAVAGTNPLRASISTSNSPASAAATAGASTSAAATPLTSQGSFFENAAHDESSEDFDPDDEDEDDDFRLG